MKKVYSIEHLCCANCAAKIEEKLKALRDSFWRSHNAGFCDYMAGREMGGEVSGDTELWDLDCKYKYKVDALIDLLKEEEKQ